MSDWFYNTDGAVQVGRRGPEAEILVAELPWALLTIDASEALEALKSLKKVSLKGRHFAMRRVDLDDIAAISSAGKIRCFSLNGTLLDARALSKVFQNLTDLEELDVRGLAVNNNVLSVIIDTSPHLRALSVGWAKVDGEHEFAPFDLGSGVLAKTRKLRSLDKLSVRGMSITDADVLAESHLSRLTDIDIADTEVSSLGFQHLGKHGRLRRVVLDSCPIDDSVAPTLSVNSDLELLSAERTRISDTTLAVLGGLPRLSHLNLTSTLVYDGGLANLAGHPKLRSLMVADTALSAEAIAHFVSQTPSMRSLKVGRTPFAPADVSIFDKLDELELGIRPDPAEFSALAKLPGRIDLSVFGFPAGILPLPQELRSLRLGAPLRSDIVRSIAPLQKLRDLSIQSGAHLLSDLQDGELPGLRNIFAQAVQLNDAAIGRLANLPALEALYISENPITDTGIAALEAKPYLHTLELRSVPLAPGVLDTLLSLPALHCLDLPGTGLSPGSISRLGQAPTLQSLAIDASQLTEESIDGLAGLETLMELYLYGDGYTVEAFALLDRLPYLNEVFLIGSSQSIKLDSVPAFANIRRLRHLKGAIDNDAQLALSSARPDIYINRTSSKPIRTENIRNTMLTFSE